MIRRQWISYLFIIAFAMALAHNILPHTHPKETGKEVEHHHGGGTKPHSHNKDEHRHSHSHNSKEQLPVFTHFANAEFTILEKQPSIEKQKLVLEFDEPVLVSSPLPAFPSLPAPIPYARDLPQDFFLLERSLRAPPHLS